MNRIYVSNNYIIIEEGSRQSPFQMSSSHYDEGPDSFRLESRSSGKFRNIAFLDVGDWQDVDSVTFTVSTLRDFLQTNTGNKKGGRDGQTGDLITQQVVELYADLLPGEEGDLSYVIKSSGNRWLPGSMGGAFRSSGIYRFESGIWVYDNDALYGDFDQLNRDTLLHINNRSNPHGVTKSQVGLSMVDNTADSDKPVSDSVQGELDRLEWILLVSRWDSPPVLESGIPAGEVYSYELGGRVAYRLVPSPYIASEDCFYSNFNGTILTNKIASRGEFI